MTKIYVENLRPFFAITSKVLKFRLFKAAWLGGLILTTTVLHAQTVVHISGATLQTWTAPTTGGPYFVRISAKGGDGGVTSPKQAGQGATLSGIFKVEAGQTIRAISGAKGTNGDEDRGATGGGGTGAVNASTNTLLVLAGGGGGGGKYFDGKGALVAPGNGDGGAYDCDKRSAGGGLNGPGAGIAGGGQVSLNGLSAGGVGGGSTGGSGMGGGGGITDFLDASGQGSGGGGQTGGECNKAARSQPGGDCQNNTDGGTTTSPQDGYVNIELLATQTYYRDADHDGFGDAATPALGSAGCVPTGYTVDNTDPNDADAGITGPVLNISGANIATWTAPATGGPFFIRITARGGDGGNSLAGTGTVEVRPGGEGATLSGIFKVEAGQTIRAISGSRGGSALMEEFSNGGGGGAGAGAVNASTGTLLLLAGGGQGGAPYYSTFGDGASVSPGNGNGGTSICLYAAAGGGLNGAGQNSSYGGGFGGGQVNFNGISAGGGTNSGNGGSGMGGGGGATSTSGGGGGGQTGGSGCGFPRDPASSQPGGDCQNNTAGGYTFSPQDGYVKVELLTTQFYYQDSDGDGYGNPNQRVTGPSGCTPSGYVTNNTDFNDSDAGIHLLSITCSADIKVDNDPGKCGAVINYSVPPVPATEYMFDLTVVQTAGLAPGAAFPVGITINSFALVQHGTDTLARCSSTVTVEDKEAPGFTPPAAREVTLHAACSVIIPNLIGGLTGSDNCGGNINFSQLPAAGTVVSASHGQIIVVTVTAADIHGNKKDALVQLTAADHTAPTITCTPAQNFCYSTSGNYTIPALQASDNCSGALTTTYSITGATTRSGSNNNASGVFNTGVNTIAWTVKDIKGNQSTCSTTVTINKQITVAIPDVKVLARGVDANTVYPGYAPAASITLTANASGGTNTFTYKWSNGATTKSIAVSPTALTTYSVTVTDGSQCTGTASKQVLIVNVGCGGSKVNVCHGGGTLCIDKSSIPDHLNHGDKLGKCGNTKAKASANEVDEEKVGTAAVYPNPTTGSFRLQLNNVKEETAQATILDSKGRVIEQRTVLLTLGQQALSFNLQGRASGLYLVTLTTPSGNKKIFKVMLQ